MIGLDDVAGTLDSRAVAAWHEAGRPLDVVRSMDAVELSAAVDRGPVTVLDVRGRAEWDAARIPAIPNVPLGYLADHLPELPRDRTVVLQCQSGGRSAIAASLLQLHGFRDVVNLAGGLEAWEAAGLPVERGAEGAAERVA